MKRILAGLLAMLLILAEPCCMSAADALSANAAPIRSRSIGTEKEGSAGCNVFSMEVQGNNAKVTFESVVDAILIVAVYNEEGTQMLTFGRTEVSAQQKEALLEIDSAGGQKIPKYFYLRGMLLEKDTLRPLCSAYESPVYTKGMNKVQPPRLSDDVVDCPLEREGVSANLHLEVHPSVNIYESKVYRYAEIRLDYTAKVSGLKVSEPGETVFSLPQMASFPQGTSLSVKVSADNAAELEAEWSGTIGCSVQNGLGIHNLTNVPSLRASMAKEGNVSMELAADFTNMELLDAADTLLSMKAAVTTKVCGRLTYQEESVSVRHDCESCLHGESYSKIEADYQAQTRSTGINDAWQNSYEVLNGLFYHSSNGDKSDTQPCPRQKYRTTFMVVDADGSRIENAQVQAISMETAEAIVLRTDKNGRVSEYLPGGSYEVNINTPDGGLKTITVKVNDQAQSMRIRMGAFPVEGILPDEVITSSALKAKSIVLGETYSGVLSQDGYLYTWGMNTFGQLGIGTTDKFIYVPEKIGLSKISFADFGKMHGGAVTENGDLYTWGNNEHGQLGYQTVKGYFDYPTRVELPGKVIAISMGAAHSGAVLEDGSLYTWGKNTSCELGYDTVDKEYNPKPEKVAALEHVTDFSCGSRHSGAVTEDGTLYTWGSNTDAQLGRHTPDQQEAAPGKVDMPGGGKVLNIDFGFEHSAAITEDGLYMWGKDFFMGTPSGQNRPVKIDISNSIAVSLYPDGMNNGVVTSDGFLYTWGSNDYGELGDGTTNDRFVPEKVATLSHIQSACMGQETSGAVTRDGSVYVWGTNAFGLRGDGSSSLNDRITEPYQLSFAGNDTAVFHHLTPDETYEFYMVKDKTKSDLLSPDNLLYTTQGIADSSGTLEISYLTLNDYSHVEIFVKGADKKEISLAQAEASDMEYNGEIQYVQPAVSYHGKMLIEGKDYELIGDYCGQEADPYTVWICGIGDYKGKQAVTYKILPGRKLVENITLSLADGSVEAGSALQLTAQVFPKDAQNPALYWNSENPDIAVVDQNGLVTGIREGKARITASSQDGSNITAGCVITVTVRPSDNNTGDSSGGTDDSSGGGSDSSPGGSTGGSSNGGSGSSSNGNFDNSGNSGSGSSHGGSAGNVELNLLYYLVHFNSNGGNHLSRNEMTLLMDDKLGILPDVKRKDYVFAGWYTQKEKGRKVEENTVLNASMTLYAHWDKVQKPGRVTKLSLKRQNGGQALVQYQAVDLVQGYEITCSTNPQFTAKASRKKLVLPASALEQTLVKPKKNKTCYIRVRAYRTDSVGHKIYGAYSSVKKIKL